MIEDMLWKLVYTLALKETLRNWVTLASPHACKQGHYRRRDEEAIEKHHTETGGTEWQLY